MTSPTRRVLSSLAGVALATLAVVAGLRAATIRSSGTRVAGERGWNDRSQRARRNDLRPGSDHLAAGGARPRCRRRHD